MKNEGITKQINIWNKKESNFSMRGEGGAGEAELWCLLQAFTEFFDSFVMEPLTLECSAHITKVLWGREGISQQHHLAVRPPTSPFSATLLGYPSPTVTPCSAHLGYKETTCVSTCGKLRVRAIHTAMINTLLFPPWRFTVWFGVCWDSPDPWCVLQPGLNFRILLPLFRDCRKN